jgi:AcrR family transcriptional regulator
MSPRPKDSTKEKALENRQRILDSAEATFAAKGFDGANMREIAAAAGVNKFMLYYHFEDKQTLFEQVLNAILTPVFRKLSVAIDPAPDLETAIGNVYQIYADLFAARGGRLRSFMAREIAAGAPRAKLLFKIKAPELAVLWGVKLSEYAGQEVPPKQIAQLVMSIMTSIVSTFLMSPLFEPIFNQFEIDRADPEFKQHVVQYTLGGVDNCLADLRMK